MALRNKIIAGTAALGIAFASVAPAMAQDKAPATGDIPPVYTSMEQVQSDPAFRNGVIIQTDGSYLRADSVAAALLTKHINAAIVNGGLDDGMIRIYLDGQTSENVYFTEQAFGENATTILHSLSTWNARKQQQANQEPTHSHPIPNQD